MEPVFLPSGPNIRIGVLRLLENECFTAQLEVKHLAGGPSLSQPHSQEAPQRPLEIERSLRNLSSFHVSWGFQQKWLWWSTPMFFLLIGR